MVQLAMFDCRWVIPHLYNFYDMGMSLNMVDYDLRVIPTLTHHSDLVSDIPSGRVYIYIYVAHIYIYIDILTFQLTFFLAYLTFYLTFHP